MYSTQLVLRRLSLTLMLLIALASTASIAQSEKPKPAIGAEVVQPQTLLKTSTDESIVLKAQLATMQGLTDGMLATVHWSLGTVVLVASLLVGFGWFNNAKAHERELTSLRTELQGMIIAKSAESRESLEVLVQANLKEAVATESSVAKAIFEQRDRVHQKKIQGLESSLHETSTKVELWKLKSDARYWEFRGVPANELDQHIRILEWAVSQENGLEISESIKKIQAFLAAGTKVMVSTITDISGILDMLPRDQAIHAEALRLTLKSAKTY